MTVTIARVNTSVENFSSLYAKVNQCIDAISNNAVTVSTAANGSLSTGNGYVNGIFGSLTLTATTIRGGNVQANSTLAIYANTLALVNTISIGNSTVNVTANSTTINAAMFSTYANSTSGFTANSTAIWLNGTAYTTLVSNILVQNSGTNVGSHSILNFIQGAGANVTIVDNTAQSRIDITVAVSADGTGLPGGANGYIQFNDDGDFGGDANLYWTAAQATLTVSNTVSSDRFDMTNGRLRSFYANSSSTSNVVVDSFQLADYRGGDYVVTAIDRAANNRYISKFLVLYDGGAVTLSEYGMIYSNNDFATFTATTNSTHIIINYASTSSNSFVKGVRTLVSI